MPLVSGRRDSGRPVRGGPDLGNNRRIPIGIIDWGFVYFNPNVRTATLDISQTAKNPGDDARRYATLSDRVVITLMINKVDAQAFFPITLLIDTQFPAWPLWRHGRNQHYATAPLAKAPASQRTQHCLFGKIAFSTRRNRNRCAGD